MDRHRTGGEAGRDVKASTASDSFALPLSVSALEPAESHSRWTTKAGQMVGAGIELTATTRTVPAPVLIIGAGMSDQPRRGRNTIDDTTAGSNWERDLEGVEVAVVR